MKPAPFRYHRPRDVQEAVALLHDLLGRGGHAKVLAGGQSLLPVMSMRLASPEHLVDINAVAGLDEVGVTADGVRIGALVRHRDLERDAAAFAALPLLRETLQHVAHPTIRNRGTTVGSICHADPSAEMPAVLAMVGGYVVAASVRGERQVPASELFVGPLETSLAEDELAVAAVFPTLPAGTGSAMVEVARRHGDYAVCGVVATVSLDDEGRVGRVRAGYLSAGDSPAPLDLSAPVAGSVVADADWAAVGELAREVVPTDADIHASAQYRSQLVAVLTERAVRTAASRAQDGPHRLTDDEGHAA
ncbi:MAG TPA: FAD binding domain-containing protein [Actinomycetales bacterium]|nr:FAD binding domain-containing protein [Actinomycetales bacterium]